MSLDSAYFSSGQETRLNPYLTYNGLPDSSLQPDLTSHTELDTEQTVESPSAQAEEVAFLNEIISMQKTNIADLTHKVGGLHATIQLLSKNLEKANRDLAAANEREAARKADQEVLQKSLVDLQANRQTMQIGLNSMEDRLLKSVDEMKEKEKIFIDSFEKNIGKKGSEAAQKKINEDAERLLRSEQLAGENECLKLHLFQLQSYTQTLMNEIQMLKSRPTFFQYNQPSNFDAAERQ